MEGRTVIPTTKKNDQDISVSGLNTENNDGLNTLDDVTTSNFRGFDKKEGFFELLSFNDTVFTTVTF